MPLTKQEQEILESIIVASDNDPNHPEFPPENPKFPATSTYQIQVPGFSNVWLKDESQNPTGTHKDRMAWEIIVTYRDMLLARKNSGTKEPLPEMSLISSGSSALAIQTQLKKYNLPNLRVLTDIQIRKEILENLRALGCLVFTTDLSTKSYTWEDILRLTENLEGIDITSIQSLDQNTRFYDWLSYEIINSSPDYCFIPFGTGSLYVNVMNIAGHEISSVQKDPRFRGDIAKLRQCNFMGATTNNPLSKAEKLYSPYLPFVSFNEPWLRMYKMAGFCGPDSNVLLFEEKYLEDAMNILEKQGVDCEPSGAAGLALMLQMQATLDRDQKMLVVSTGKVKAPTGKY